MQKLILLVCLAGMVFMLTGCISDASGDEDSRLPWNKPADWEGQQLGVPL